MTDDQGGGYDGGGDGNNESGWVDHNQNGSFEDNNGIIHRCSRSMYVMIVCTIISVSCIIGGTTVLSSSISKSNNYSETTGIIIGIRSCGRSCSNNNNNNTCSETFGAIIEYTVNDMTYNIEPSSCSDSPLKVGNNIRVLYDPDNPQEGVDGSWIGLYLDPTILLVIGITAFLSIVVLRCIASRRKFLGKDKPVKTNGAITMSGDSPMITAPSTHVMSSNPKPASFPNTAPHTELVAPTESKCKPDYSTVTPLAYPVANSNPNTAPHTKLVAPTESPFKSDYSTVTPIAYPVANSNTSEPVSIFDQLKATKR